MKKIKKIATVLLLAAALTGSLSSTVFAAPKSNDKPVQYGKCHGVYFHSAVADWVAC